MREIDQACLDGMVPLGCLLTGIFKREFPTRVQSDVFALYKGKRVQSGLLAYKAPQKTIRGVTVAWEGGIADNGHGAFLGSMGGRPRP